MTAKYISQSETSPNTLLPRQPNSYQRILVVEDDPLIRRLNTEVLTFSGFQVDAAEDGAAAWVAIQNENYDLIVTDNDMPNLTGVELLQSLHEARLALPVILATSTIPQDDLDRHPWLHIDATLLKPYSFHELLAAVKNVLATINRTADEFVPSSNYSVQPLTDRLSL
ncbi:MAG: response regulator [Verrucomicrobiae bacterium]|nr:response regulator [Verrucomicrobiae bacterium]